MMLRRYLDLADKTGTILVVTLDVHSDILVVIQEIDMLDIVRADFNNVVLRNDFLQKELKETQTILLKQERPLEPAVQDDARIAPHRGLLHIAHKKPEYGLPRERPAQITPPQVPSHKGQPEQRCEA